MSLEQTPATNPTPENPTPALDSATVEASNRIVGSEQPQPEQAAPEQTPSMITVPEGLGIPAPATPEQPAPKFGDVVPHEARFMEGASRTPEELATQQVTSLTPGSVNTSPGQIQAALAQKQPEQTPEQ